MRGRLRGAIFLLNNHEFCSQSHEFCIETDEFFTHNDDLRRAVDIKIRQLRAATRAAQYTLLRPTAPNSDLSGELSITNHEFSI